MDREDTTVRVKAVGSRKAVEQFFKILEEIFSLVVAGPVMPNDRDDGVHAFLNLDPFLAKVKMEKEMT
jgi:acylphosphatase